MDLGGKKSRGSCIKSISFYRYLKRLGGEEDGLSCNIRNEPMI